MSKARKRWSGTLILPMGLMMFALGIVYGDCPIIHWIPVVPNHNTLSLITEIVSLVMNAGIGLFTTKSFSVIMCPQTQKNSTLTQTKP